MGDLPASPLEKDGYVLEWADEFDGDELDLSKWVPFYLPHWSSRERTAPKYVMRDGCLVLQIVEGQEAWCPEFDGEVKTSCIQTGEWAGPVGSKLGQLQFSPELVVREAQENVRLYTPQYGYFECRAKCVNTQGFMVALWMIGYEDEPERSGEICMFEVFAKDVSATSAKVGNGVHPWQDPKLSEDFRQDEIEMDATEFHVYAVDWTEEYVDFLVDGKKIRRVEQSPDYPMQFMLSIYEHPGRADDTVFPVEFVVDYVRGYRRVGK